MRRPTRRALARLGLALAALATFAGLRPARADEPAPDRDDPVLLRRLLLARLDAEADARAARDHLAARLAMDAVLPIPYFGIDADPVDGGMKVTRVYPNTSAAAAGLAVGDLVVEVDGRPTDTPAALGRAIRRARVGATLTVAWVRAGVRTTSSAVLSRRPEEDEDEDEQFPDTAAAAAAPGRRTFAFDGPDAFAGLEPLLGGHGAAPRFEGVAVDGGRALRQADGDPTGIRFPLAAVRDFAALDVSARVRFRLVGGVNDRAAGIVVRMKDPANFLVARANAVEGDLRLFRTVNGLRRTLPGAIAKAAFDDGAWHTLEVKAEGPRLTAVLDGTTTVTSYDTYFGRGRVALWTKSDSVTEFDDFAVEGTR
ncbi:MAG: PDZ domain-containing protein [Planctomycetota bacterium]